MKISLDMDQIRADLADVRVKTVALGQAWARLPQWVRRRQAVVITLGEELPDGFCDPSKHEARQPE